jgi:hypothetical protein
MTLATAEQVGDALSRLGHYRVVRAQEQAALDQADGIDGAHILALGLRETWGRNIEGGAKLEAGRWVLETDPARMDVGWLQISRRYHPQALAKMPGVAVKTWGPVIEGRTANDGGYVPRFTDALRFTVDELGASMAYGRTHGVDGADLARFAVAAHNAGAGGALRGYQAGDVDRNTAGGDYSRWVMDAYRHVVAWLRRHPNWRY